MICLSDAPVSELFCCLIVVPSSNCAYWNSSNVRWVKSSCVMLYAQDPCFTASFALCSLYLACFITSPTNKLLSVVNCSLLWISQVPSGSEQSALDLHLNLVWCRGLEAVKFAHSKAPVIVQFRKYATVLLHGLPVDSGHLKVEPTNHP